MLSLKSARENYARWVIIDKVTINSLNKVKCIKHLYEERKIYKVMFITVEYTHEIKILFETQLK